jgi:hypothetical protein
VNKLTKQDAMKFIARLRFLIIQEGNEGGPISALENSGVFVQLQSMKKRQQDTLDEFLERHEPLKKNISVEYAY